MNEVTGELGQQLVIFVLGRQRFAVSLHSVIRVVAAAQWTWLPDAPEVVLGIIDFHGQIIPLVDPRRGLRRLTSDVSVADEFIIVHTGRRTIALLVNRTVGVVVRKITPLSRACLSEAGCSQYTGTVTMDDELVLIHDIERFLSIEELHALDEALKEHMLEDAR